MVVGLHFQEPCAIVGALGNPVRVLVEPGSGDVVRELGRNGKVRFELRDIASFCILVERNYQSAIKILLQLVQFAIGFLFMRVMLRDCDIREPIAFIRGLLRSTYPRALGGTQRASGSPRDTTISARSGQACRGRYAMRRLPPPVGRPEDGHARRAEWAPRRNGSSTGFASAMRKSTRFALWKSGAHNARDLGGGALRLREELAEDRVCIGLWIRVCSFLGVRDLPRTVSC